MSTRGAKRVMSFEPITLERTMPTLNGNHASPVLNGGYVSSEDRCSGRLACSGDQLAPLPGAVLLTLQVEALS